MSSPILQLASNQRDIWLDQIAHPESPLYNIGGTLIISGKVDYKALNLAVKHLINENDAFHINLNTQIPIQQKLVNDLPFQLEFIDFSSHTTPQDNARLWLDKTFKQPFSFNKNNQLWHFALIKESEQRYYLLTKYHHVIADGWSTTVVIARLAEIYNAFLNNQSIDTKPSQRYFNFIEKEQEYLHSPSYKSDNEYWKKILPEPPTPLIPRRYPVSINTLLPKSNIHRFNINRNFYNKINDFSLANKSTSYHTFLIALASYFSRIHQREDIIIGVPSLNRSGARYKDVLGMFISLSPLVLQIPQTENAYQILQNCRTRLRELYRHHRFPLGDISKRLKLLQNGRDTLFDLVLSYEKHEYSAPYGNATISAKQQFSGVARYPLAVTICEFSEIDDVEIIFEGAENCFSTQDLQFLADRLQLILQQMLNHPQKPANELNLLTKNDENIIFSHFNHKKTHHQQSLPSVVQLFQQQAINNASKTAVEFQKLTLSYQQLDQLSNQLATHLINQGIKSNDIVAICLPRSMEMIIGLLAILKASAAYLPIPIDIPDERISNILQQSKAQALLTLSHFKPRLSLLNSNTIFINDYQLQQGHSVQHTNIKSDNLAYIIFTSGSSGQAKGVMIDHAALSSRIQWLQSLFKITPKDRMGQTIQYNFDPSIIEIFLSLTQGACLVLTPENSYTAESFAPFIINQKITSLALVPSSVRMLLQGLKPSQKTHIRVVCCGGERLEPSLAKQFLQQTEAQLFNVYGPTEATIIASAWECEKDFSVESLPIGKPADNTPIVIIDRQLKTLPVNEIGEIAIAGNTLAQGYVNQAELTTVAFPINSHDHTRLYKTGDLGYIAYDGLLYFSGRIDRQIKISGYRIELGEIESILQLNDNVNIAAVTTASTGQQTSIYAYVETTVKDTDTLIKELSLILLQKLPSYMQPRRIIPVTTIKTSLTGKIDYASLPSVNKLEESDKGVSPRNLLETQLQEIWSKTLSSKKISIHDNFFELGGDSLSAISLMVAIEQLTGIRQPLSFLLEYPSIAEQAGALHQKTSNNSLITLSNHSAAIPLFIAASGNGDFLRLSNLAKAMGSICNIHMLQPPEDTEKTLSIHAIAQCYADLIEPYTNAPYYISGFSIGGITALETAKILVERHKAPEGIILLDSIYPRWPLQSPWLFKSIEYSIKLFRLSNIKINNRRLEVMLNDAGIKSQLKSLSNHKIQAVDLSLELILTKDMWMFHPLIFSSWSKLFKSKLTRHSVTGLHGEMFHQPHLHELTKILKKLVTSKKN